MSEFFDPSPILGGPGNIQNATTIGSRVLSHVDKPDGSASPCGETSSGARTDRTEEYAVQEVEGSFSVPAVGSITDTGYHIDNVQVEWKTDDWPRVIIVGHLHDGTVHPPVSRTFSPSIYLPAGWGVVPPYAGEACTSVLYVLTCQHYDALDERGDVFGSDDTRGVETVEAKTQEGPLYSPGTGWTVAGPSIDEDLSTAREWGQKWQRAF